MVRNTGLNDLGEIVLNQGFIICVHIMSFGLLSMTRIDTFLLCSRVHAILNSKQIWLVSNIEDFKYRMNYIILKLNNK